MKATLVPAGALLAAVVAASTASANPFANPFNSGWGAPNYPYPGFRVPPYVPYPGYRVTPWPIPTAPDMCNPGFYVQCPNNVWYGPNYCIKPPFLPFQGVLPGPQGKAIEEVRHTSMGPSYGVYPGKPAQPGAMSAYPGYPAPTHNVFPTHPFARSPRDFFMWRENKEQEEARGLRPSLVP